MKSGRKYHQHPTIDHGPNPSGMKLDFSFALVASAAVAGIKRGLYFYFVVMQVVRKGVGGGDDVKLKSRCSVHLDV